MKEYERLLEGIGLTKGEIKVYLTLLNIGETTTGRIIKESGVSGSKTYVILEKLIQKGFVNYIIKGKTKYFNTTSPTRILNYIDKKNKEMETKKEEIKKIIPNFLKIKKEESLKSSTTIYEGYNGIKTAIYETIENKNKDDEWLAFGIGLKLSENLTNLWNNFNKTLYNKKIKTKLLFANSSAKKQIKPNKFMETRIMTNDALAPISIFNDIIIIYNWKEPSVVKIKDAEIANSFRVFFYNLWKLSKVQLKN
jgi:sugar-specific transcriptional regulator TrmB